LLLLLANGRLDAAEADAVALVGGRLALAGGAAAALGRVGERASADHALLCARLGARRAVGRGALVAGRPGVAAPLPDVAVQVVQPPRVGLLAADRRVLALGVGAVPGMGAQVGDPVAERVGGGGACAAGVLPLRLAGQADLLAGRDQLARAEQGRDLAA